MALAPLCLKLRFLIVTVLFIIKGQILLKRMAAVYWCSIKVLLPALVFSLVVGESYGLESCCSDLGCFNSARPFYHSVYRYVLLNTGYSVIDDGNKLKTAGFILYLY